MLTRVALIGLYWRGRGGATTSAITYWPAIKHWGIDAEFLVFSHRGKPKTSEPVQDVIPPRHIKYTDAAEYINENFDAVHFWTMGNTSDKKHLHLDVLEDIELPWMCSIRAPNDFKRYEMWEEMLSTGDFRGSHFISERLRAHAIAEYPEFFNEANTVAAECTLDPSKIDIPDLEEKLPVVVQHTRCASIKRPHLLVEMADKLYDGGIVQIDIYGRCEYWSYENRLVQLDNYPIVDWKGSFEVDEVPSILKPAMFDCDLTYHGPHDGARPQNTTLEAMAYGAIPIVQDQWCNEQMRDMEHVIAVRKDHEVEDGVPKILRVLHDPELYRTMVENNRKFVPEWFNRSKNLTDFYTRIAS